MVTTVRTYLSSNCVRTLPGYGVREDGIEGIDYDSAYCCTPGNVRHIRCPLLIMGMTGGLRVHRKRSHRPKMPYPRIKPSPSWREART